jgi:hypothetical protein
MSHLSTDDHAVHLNFMRSARAYSKKIKMLLSFTTVLPHTPDLVSMSIYQLLRQLDKVWLRLLLERM